MYTAKDYRIMAKAALGDAVFGKIWPLAAVAILVYSLVSLLVGYIPIVGFAGMIVVYGALMTGMYSVMLSLNRGANEVNIGGIFSYFDGRSIGLGALQYLYIFLWTLLFYVPGIIKSYSYAMAYFVHIDHPELTPNQCITESRRLMNGNKWRLFCLDISFIGWAIVGSLACGIGTLWVNAWMYEARAVFYDDLIARDSGTVVIE